MAIKLNFYASPSTTSNTVLGDVVVNIEFEWQELNQAWYIYVYTIDNVVLTKRSKLIPYLPLLRLNTREGPDGNIFLIPKSKANAEMPGRDNIGPNKDFVLVYYTNTELGR